MTVAKIRNSDIAWDGSDIGLLPRVAGRSSKKALKLGRAAIPALVLALDDPERFAAAHVLLTDIVMAGVVRPLSSAHWNGMRVDLHGNGSVRLYPEQRDELKAFWRAKTGGA